jgi:DNA modification methylase
VTPYYQDDLVTIYHGDAYAVVSTLAVPDLVCTDPPYGIGWRPRVNHRDSPWRDDARPMIAPLLVGRRNVVWGGNYFAPQLPVSEAWLVWVKRPAGYDFDNDTRSYATCEIAWSDFGGKPRTLHHTWDGGLRAGDRSNREFSHPAQKPVELMRWCIGLAPNLPTVVLDPFAGSGATLVAAKSMGRRAIGIEIEERYCEIAARRCSQDVLGLSA